MLDEIFFLYILVICTRLNGAKKSKCAHTTQNARKTQLYRSNRTQTRTTRTPTRKIVQEHFVLFKWGITKSFSLHLQSCKSCVVFSSLSMVTIDFLDLFLYIAPPTLWVMNECFTYYFCIKILNGYINFRYIRITYFKSSGKPLAAALRYRVSQAHNSFEMCYLNSFF